jgi:hypothetical protein
MACASVALNVWGGRQSSLQARGVVLTSGLSAVLDIYKTQTDLVKFHPNVMKLPLIHPNVLTILQTSTI